LHADNRQTAGPHRAGEPKRASAHQALDWRGAISRDPHARLWRFPAARTYTLTRARTVPNALLGEALFGGLDHTLTHPPLATSRERSRPHAWAKPALAGRPTALVPLPTCRDATQTSMWAKPCLAARPTTRAPIYTFRERSRTQAWAKPCLAGRPTALVRTQSPEQNTSRGRPPGMELPDYPVVVLTPTPKDQDGPALRPPAGSFPGFVPRYASRRVFSRIRTSLCFPPGLSRIRSSLCFPPVLVWFFFLFLFFSPDFPRRLDHEFKFPFLLVPREQVPKHG
jgi:hypothetical protein